jgi:hypothetical protein
MGETLSVCLRTHHLIASCENQSHDLPAFMRTAFAAFTSFLA